MTARSVNKVALLGNVARTRRLRFDRRRHHGRQLHPRHQRPPEGRSRATGRTAPSGTIWSPSPAPPKSFATM